jgi:hypothetical protein
MRRFSAMVAVLLLWGCGENARDQLAAARKSLAEAHYPDAIAAADAGLALKPDDVTAWGLELARLEALARAGRGDDTLAQLAKLAQARPANVPADQYAATADQLRAAGQGAAAIQALDQGLQRFPQDDALRGQIEQAKAAPAPGSEELKMLESLGYIDKK